MSTIIFAGDLCPQGEVAYLFDQNRYDEVLSEAKPIVEQADYSFVNLEAPIVNGCGTPIKKSGPNLKCSNKIIGAIKYIGFKGVTLANNHFYDYGDEGAMTTIRELEENGIDYVGAGKNITDALRTLYVKIKNETFAFINCCEHEFSIATEKSAGSNPLDIVGQYNAIIEAKKKANRVVLIVHGGIEHFQLPTPRMVDTYRFFVKVGADAVINHHQHCFSGYEYYMGKPIVYGLGNFCFEVLTKRNKNKNWYQGYLLSLSFEGERVIIKTYPYNQCETAPIIQFSTVDYNVFESRLKELCDIIKDSQLLFNEYKKLLQNTWKDYDILNPYTNRYVNWLHRNGWLPSTIPRKKMCSILDVIQCESHRERLIHALGKIIE